MSVATIVKQEETDSFFGQVDRAPKVAGNGKFSNDIGSSYPAYMLETNINKLKDKIEETEASLESGFVPPTEVEYTKRELRNQKERYEAIINSKRDISPEEMVKIRNEASRLNEEVSSSMFVRKDMEKGLVDPHREAKRMSMPCIPVDEALARKCNVRTYGGKANRNEADRMRKILTWLATNGEGDLNTERLRRDSGGSVTGRGNMVVVPDLSGIKMDLADKPATVNVENNVVEPNIMWTCEDCGKTVKERGKHLHKLKWCKGKKEGV